LNLQPPFKGTMMFATTFSHRLYGWNESLWLGQSSFDAALQALEVVAVQRLGLLPSPVRITDLRVTHPSLPRASEARMLRRNGTYPETEHSIHPNFSLNVRFASAEYSTTYSLCGVPKGVFKGEELAATAAWDEAFKNYAAAVVTHCLMVNKRHVHKDDRAAAGDEVVVNSVRSLTATGLSLRRRGGGAQRVRGRRRRSR
jgi:hypothetical protein